MKSRKILVLVMVIFSVMLSSFSFYVYQVIKTPNILVQQEDTFLHIYSGMTFKQLLDAEVHVEKTSRYTAVTSAETVDWRSKIHPKKALKNNPFYKPCNYNQIFGKEFVGNLSIIDLLFCEGASAREILQNSKT